MKNRLSYNEKAIIFVGALTVFKLIYTIGLNVIPDEAYYYLWGKNLALSYFDHPPMIGWFFGFLSLFFKSAEFVVHLQPILLGAGTSLYAYYLGKEMFNEKIGFTFLVMSNMTLLLFCRHDHCHTGHAYDILPDRRYISLSQSVQKWKMASMDTCRSVFRMCAAFQICSSFNLSCTITVFDIHARTHIAEEHQTVYCISNFLYCISACGDLECPA